MVRTIKKELILQYNIKEDMNGCFKTKKPPSAWFETPYKSYEKVMVLVSLKKNRNVSF